MPQFFRSRRSLHLAHSLSATCLGLALVCCVVPVSAQTPDGVLMLPGHVPDAVSHAEAVSELTASRPVSLAITLPLRNQAALKTLLHNLYDPKSSDYGHFLTSEEFDEQFGPTQQAYDRAVAYAEANGLAVTGTSPGRTVLDVSAPAAQVERTFGMHLLVYRSETDGRYFYAPDAEPNIPASLAGVVSGIVGLDNAAQWHPHYRVLRGSNPYQPSPLLDDDTLPLEIGTGPGSGLAPSDIKTAYGLSGVTQNGGGQTLGLFELDGYTASDITKYETQFGLPAVPLQNILIDSATGKAGSGADEVTLDIELQAALAPSASKILVYEAPNSDTGVVDLYTKIASDNLAKEISTSWGEAEADDSASVRNSENTAFQKMATQGQSIFAAAGDSGADDNGSSLSVDDPASQPYMVGVGGLSLTTNGAGGSYKSETTWNGGSASAGAGGGGISTVWTIPSFQSGVVGSAASKGSTTMRNVPDVSLDADPNTGYAIYVGGAWNIYGGTSCAAPLWSAFTALVNQARTANGSSLLGFADPPIYTVAEGSRYATDFHDIKDNSTNLYYPGGHGL